MIIIIIIIIIITTITIIIILISIIINNHGELGTCRTSGCGSWKRIESIVCCQSTDRLITCLMPYCVLHSCDIYIAGERR